MNNPKKYGRAKECADRYCVSISTWWRWMKEGRLPKPVKIGPRVTAWEFAELDKRLVGKEAQEHD